VHVDLVLARRIACAIFKSKEPKTNTPEPMSNMNIECCKVKNAVAGFSYSAVITCNPRYLIACKSIYANFVLCLVKNTLWSWEILHTHTHTYTNTRTERYIHATIHTHTWTDWKRKCKSISSLVRVRDDEEVSANKPSVLSSKTLPNVGIINFTVVHIFQ